MRTTIIGLAVAVAFTASTYADKNIDYSHLPPRVQQTIREYKGEGEVKKVKTRRLDNGQIVYEVDYKERGDEKQIVIGQDGFVVGDERQLEKSRGKGKGKGKDKDKQKDRDQDREEEERAVTPPPAAAPAPFPPQAQRTEAQAAAFERQVKALHTLAANERAFQAGLTAIAKESGVPVKTLQAQQKQYKAGPAGLLMANELARITKRPAQQFFAERKGKEEWDAIAARNGVNPDLLLPKLQRVHRAMAEASKQ